MSVTCIYYFNPPWLYGTRYPATANHTPLATRHSSMHLPTQLLLYHCCLHNAHNYTGLQSLSPGCVSLCASLPRLAWLKKHTTAAICCCMKGSYGIKMKKVSRILGHHVGRIIIMLCDAFSLLAWHKQIYKKKKATRREEAKKSHHSTQKSKATTRLMMLYFWHTDELANNQPWRRNTTTNQLTTLYIWIKRSNYFAFIIITSANPRPKEVYII